MLNDHKQAEAYALVADAQEEFFNFLTAIGDIDLDVPEIGEQAKKVGNLLEKAKGTLDVC